MQYNTFALFSTILAAATLASANSSQCDTGAAQCCNTVEKASDPSAASILKSIGVVVQHVDALVDLGCTTITVIGAGGTNCAQQPVCCTDDKFEGLINIGCTPISL
ncbi:hypothetical protein M422DRAFT_247838 [Sphaerobolus stellatus SS14]|nr:hypothetical protein M422DRAFT_247838 [Sphaerobolus stellatus SS14]